MSSASAAEPNGSVSPVYLMNSNDGSVYPAGTVLDFAAGVVSSPTTDFNDKFVGSADATSVMTFISPRGQERTPANWTASAVNSFFENTKTSWLPDLGLNKQIQGRPGNVLANGGQYSVGVAFMKNNGLTVAEAGVSYTYIDVTAGTGRYTFSTPTTTAPTEPAVGSADIGLSATTIAAADGTLSLVVPANASAAIGNATLVNNLSTSTGVLGDITVKDSRVLSHKGWTLTSTVTDFAAGSSVISAAQLSVRPRIVSTTAAADSIVTAAEGAAATTAKPFASATDAAQVGDTVLNADLKFVAPATAAAGVYTSKMTLTLTSK